MARAGSVCASLPLFWSHSPADSAPKSLTSPPEWFERAIESLNVSKRVPYLLVQAEEKEPIAARFPFDIAWIRHTPASQVAPGQGVTLYGPLNASARARPEREGR
jgi:hypothetical protein